MENSTRKSKLHPMLWVAAIAVTVLSIAGVAALTGNFPSSNSEEADPYAKTTEVKKTTPVAKATETVKKPTTCGTCGVISDINKVKVDGEGTGLGAVAGGVLGGVLGNQVGGGNGKKVATVAGVAGGAYAGHEIEKNQRATVHYDIFVNMEDGSTRRIRQGSREGLAVGDKVRVENGRVSSR